MLQPSGFCPGLPTRTHRRSRREGRVRGPHIFTPIGPRRAALPGARLASSPESWCFCPPIRYDLRPTSCLPTSGVGVHHGHMASGAQHHLTLPGWFPLSWPPPASPPNDPCRGALLPESDWVGCVVGALDKDECAAFLNAATMSTFPSISLFYFCHSSKRSLSLSSLLPLLSDPLNFLAAFLVSRITLSFLRPPEHVWSGHGHGWSPNG